MKTFLMRALLGAVITGGALAAQALNPSVDAARGVLHEWPADARDAAEALFERFGAPDMIGREELVWHGRDPFSRIAVYRQPVRHEFPVPHNDFVLHEVRLRVPPDKADELARFDGSLIVDRTRGTVASRCDSEASNLVALNLARDIAEGRRQPAAARRQMADAARLRLAGKQTRYAESLQFTPGVSTADPDARAMPSRRAPSDEIEPSVLQAPGEPQPKGDVRDEIVR